MSIWTDISNGIDSLRGYVAPGAVPPNTKVMTSHAVTIRMRGVTVGVIQSWAATQSRAIEPCYEINVLSDGSPVEKVPGSLSGTTIQVSRYDLYSKKMEQVFGFANLVMLSEQHQPFQCLELWRFPDRRQEGYLYQGCWFSNVGRQLSASDARLVLVNASLEYTRKVRTL